MADPLTALGAIAASSQLAGQLFSTSLAIYDFCLKIIDAPSSIREQFTHLEQLTSIAKLIIQNPGLQTSSVASVLGTCLRQAEELRQLLEKGVASESSNAIIRFQKAFVGVVNEKKAMGLFQQLERAKVSLGICIQEIDSRALSSISVRIQKVQSDVGKISMTMDDTVRSIRNVVEVMEPLRAEIASLHVMLPELKQVRPLQADPTASKNHQSLVRMNRQVKLNNSKRVAQSVRGFYPTPFGLLFYCKVDIQDGEDEVHDPETDDQSTVKQRIFRLVPSKLVRILGGQEVELKIAIHPGFDRVNLDFSANRLFDSGLVRTLGFYRDEFPSWFFNNPDFPLLRRLLAEGKISANNRFCDQRHFYHEERTLLHFVIKRGFTAADHNESTLKTLFELCKLLLDYGAAPETLQSALYPSMIYRHNLSRAHFHGLPPTMTGYSIPSLLLSHGASMSGPITSQDSTFSSTFPRLGSYLTYLMPLPNPLAHFHADFLRHLDTDGISELTKLDRWFTSILYHTSIDFKKVLLTCLEISKGNNLPTGILAFSELCRDLETSEEDERRRFFDKICAYGTKDVLKPFIGAGFDMPQQSLEWPIERDRMVTQRYSLSANAFKNIETFEFLAAAGIHINDFRVVLQVMSSNFILERVRDRDFLESFFGLWSPSSELRPLVLAHWMEDLSKNFLGIGDAHRAMINTLIERDYCSFPSRTSPSQHIRGKNMFLGVEVAWQVCIVIKPRSWWEVRLSQDLREERAMVLLYMLEQYRPFVDLELDRRWLPPTWEERWLGFTPLMLAVVAGDFRLAVLLVEHGAIITQPHTSENLSALDLALRNISCCHPRNWLGLSPSKLDRFPFEDDTRISAERDEEILGFLMKESKLSQELVHIPYQKSGGKTIPLTPSHPC